LNIVHKAIKFITYPIGFIIGGSQFAGKSIKNLSKKVYNNIHSFLPFFSQNDLLQWSKKVIDGTAYRKSIPKICLMRNVWLFMTMLRS